MQQNLKLLQSQVQAGRIDTQFLDRQLGKLSTLLTRLNQQQAQGQQRGRFYALYEVSKALGASLDLQVVLDRVLDAVIQISGGQRGILMLMDYDGQLRVKAARNFDQQTLADADQNYSRTVANAVLDSGQPILTTNAAEDPRFKSQASIVTQALRSIMATPLRARGSVIGVAYVDSSMAAVVFSEEDLAALDALSGQAAVAIDNALLFEATDEELSRRVDQLRQLRRIDLLLSETLDADKAMQYTLERAAQLMQAGSGALALLEGQAGRQHLLVQQRYGEGAQSLTDLGAAYPRAWDVVQAGEPLNYHDPDADCTLFLVPIRREQAVIGVVMLKRAGDAPFNIEQEDMVERVVARAAVSIENARLYAAVQAADRAKSEFVGVVAHDLKAPMTSIAGYAALMAMRGDLSEKQQDYVQKITDTVKRMEMLVSDLADISRIEGSHFFMDEMPVTVAYVMQGLRDAAQPEIQARRHTYVEEVAAGLPELWCDYYRLLQVLTNLVSNAYKYTPDGGTITVSVAADPHAPLRLRFSVTDTGIGLSDEAIAKLGTKFWRAEDRYTRSQPGTGLGFAITRSLVAQMGSHIDIESTPGEGSRFSFSVAVYDPARHTQRS